MTISFISSDGKKGLFVRVRPDGLEKGLCLDFYRDGASAIETTLLQRHLYKVLQDQMEAVRKVSYLRGWRDAKSKRKKKDWFASCVDVRDWETKEAGL